MLYAFRCKTCGHLEHAGHAGECEHPHSCSVCGSGVEWSPKGIKTVQPDNWEILADMKPDQLAKHGLKPEDVERHKPLPRGTGAREPMNLQATGSELVGSKDVA